jgi:hypothetical protein
MKRQAGGFVYAQTNDAEHNEVVVFARDAGGELERLGSHRTTEETLARRTCGIRPAEFHTASNSGF